MSEALLDACYPFVQRDWTKRQASFPESWGLLSQGIIPLHIAEMDAPPPSAWIQGLHDAAAGELVHYQKDGGAPALRREIARLESQTCPGAITEESIYLASGVRTSLASISSHIMADGGRVVVVGGPIYLPLVTHLLQRNIEIDIVPWRFTGERWSLDESELEAALQQPVKLILSNCPHNPTGAWLRDKEWEIVNVHAGKHDSFIIIDEAYKFFSSMTNGSRDGSNSNKVIRFGSFTKLFNLNGLKISHIVDHSGQIRQMRLEKLIAQPSTLSEQVLLACLKSDAAFEWAVSVRNALKANGCYLTELFNKTPYLSVETPPEVGFFLWVRHSLGDPATASDFLEKVYRLKVRSPEKFFPVLRDRFRATVPYSADIIRTISQNLSLATGAGHE